MTPKRTYRYQALSKTGKVIATGDRLMDVEGYGERLLVDFKEKRWVRQLLYPSSRYQWNKGIKQIGEIIRRWR